MEGDIKNRTGEARGVGEESCFKIDPKEPTSQKINSCGYFFVEKKRPIIIDL